ncbi:hypothetical protein SNR37_004067 [Agarivorans aestuarii]|uniref:Uncharacterized protein n=1 Tax=Agarivorans aestuarii TaxID=1563703 RepID=A0ABU7G5C7_9ALTE|nr:hypothetical protein [Agarivorans aestuarii]MEE1674624.1 hypothetical protein [Agarivorans aestuarii]
MNQSVKIKPQFVEPPANKRPKQQVHFVSGSCKATASNTLACDFTATLALALRCLEKRKEHG